VLEILLVNTWIVKDRQTAREILSYLREEPDADGVLSARLVTQSGEVFYGAGQIQRGAGQSPASLSRPREQRELKIKIAELDNLVSEQRRHALEIESAIAAAMDKEEILSSQLEEAKSRTEKAAAAHSQQEFALEQLNREMNWRSGQIESFSAEVDSLNNKVREAEGEIGLVDERISATQQLVDIEEEKLHELPVESLEREISHWATRMEIIKQGLRAAQARQNERDQLVSAANSRKTNLEISLQEMINERAELETKIEALKTNSRQIEGEIDTCSGEIVPAEAAMEEIEDKLSEFLRLESRERVMTSQAEQSFTQARISQIRKQEALDSLRRQIEADFGLVAFEYHEDVSGPTPLPLEGIVEDLPLQEQLRPELEESLKRQRALLRRIGPINPEAQAEYIDVSERFEFLSSQMHDLKEASEDVQRVIAELDEIMQREFCNTYDAVAEEFRQIFGRLFGGGSARLILTDPDDLSSTGIDIEARLPGRREQGLSLLSGGERSLTAVALVFSLLRVSPTPFCVLDEVDAMLDEANVGRFRELLRELSETTQFIMITHNRATVQVADIIYGVTMGRDSTSQILSLKVDDLEKVIN
jgi:chromosome segregation protein